MGAHAFGVRPLKWRCGLGGHARYKHGQQNQAVLHGRAYYYGRKFLRRLNTVRLSYSNFAGVAPPLNIRLRSAAHTISRLVSPLDDVNAISSWYTNTPSLHTEQK